MQFNKLLIADRIRLPRTDNLRIPYKQKYDYYAKEYINANAKNGDTLYLLHRNYYRGSLVGVYDRGDVIKKGIKIKYAPNCDDIDYSEDEFYVFGAHPNLNKCTLRPEYDKKTTVRSTLIEVYKIRS